MAEDTGTEDLVIERTYGASLDVLWAMWTDPAHFRSWYGPAGATVPVAELDVRVGGMRRVCMEVETPNGPMQMWFVGEHVVVDDRERLVYTEAVVDDASAIPSDATHPPTRVEVVFAAVPDGTRVVLTHHGVPASSPGAVGWTMALEKLERSLAA